MSARATEADAEAQILAGRLVEVLENGHGAENLFTPHALFDINVPTWRFQLQGPGAFISWFREVAPGARVSLTRIVPTASGFLIEVDEESQEDLYSRALVLCGVEVSRITEVVWYCTGGWDRGTRVRQAAEAPMVRP
jgi:hypothetical protein